MPTARERTVDHGVIRALAWVSANLHTRRIYTGYGLTLGAVYAPECISEGQLDRVMRNEIRRVTLHHLLKAANPETPGIDNLSWPELRDQLAGSERLLSLWRIREIVQAAITQANQPARQHRQTTVAA